jgi:hypothetical protein
LIIVFYFLDNSIVSSGEGIPADGPHAKADFLLVSFFLNWSSVHIRLSRRGFS